MEENISKEALTITENYLKSYRLNQKLVRLERYEREFFGGGDTRDLEAFGELPLAKPRMYDVRHFIMSLPNCDEKLILYYHYIKGLSVERCGELIGISRSSAFRKRSAALVMAAKKYVAERLGGTSSLQ